MVKAAFAKTGPIAFMRGLTFPGGQQPVIRGEGIYLRYPRIADFPVWSKLRAESREFLTPWEPVWADDELTRGAFRRRIKRYAAKVMQAGIPTVAAVGPIGRLENHATFARRFGAAPLSDAAE